MTLRQRPRGLRRSAQYRSFDRGKAARSRRLDRGTHPRTSPKSMSEVDVPSARRSSLHPSPRVTGGKVLAPIPYETERAVCPENS
jgi:hypothetical protein